MTSQTRYDKHVLIQEQREETEHILKTASERDKKPIRKLDTPDARFIVREKRSGTSNKTIADALKVCIRQAQRIWSRFRRLDTVRILYLPKRPSPPLECLPVPWKIQYVADFAAPELLPYALHATDCSCRHLAIVTQRRSHNA